MPFGHLDAATPEAALPHPAQCDELTVFSSVFSDPVNAGTPEIQTWVFPRLFPMGRSLLMGSQQEPLWWSSMNGRDPWSRQSPCSNLHTCTPVLSVASVHAHPLLPHILVYESLKLREVCGADIRLGGPELMTKGRGGVKAQLSCSEPTLSIVTPQVPHRG